MLFESTTLSVTSSPLFAAPSVIVINGLSESVYFASAVMSAVMIVVERTSVTPANQPSNVYPDFTGSAGIFVPIAVLSLTVTFATSAPSAINVTV